MPTYSYVALDPVGERVEGDIEGPSLRDAVYELKKIGFKIESVWERAPRLPLRVALMAYLRAVPLLELALFTRQFAVLLTNGVNLVEGLEGMQRQDFGKTLKSAIGDLIKGLENGQGLSASMRRRPDVFSSVYVSLVQAGEASGKLDAVLQRLAHFLERDLNLVRRIKSAMMYPILVFLVSVAIVVFMVVFVFPQFMSFFAGMHLKLPWASRILIWVTSTFQNPYVLVSLVVLIPLIARALHTHFAYTAQGNRQWAAFLLFLPLVGRIQSQVILARFCRTLATLLDAGVPQMVSLDVVAATVGNRMVTEQIENASRRVRDDGVSLARAIGEERFFPKMCGQLMRVGEEVGKVPQMLIRLADNYEMDLEISVGRFVAMLEPFMMLILGGLVGYVLIAIFLPVYSLLDAL